MDLNEYFVLELADVPDSVEDLLVGDLFDIGAAGVQENLQFTQLDRKYKPHVQEQEIKDLIAYFTEAPTADDLDRLSRSYPNVAISLNQHPIQDWLSEWKKQWKPFELCAGCWVVPEWEKEQFDSEGKQVLYIEPGMAFGTGTHETTQIAAQLLSQVIGENKIESFLDVGTGSGILALLAGLKGVPSIYAYDNDIESKRIFFENIEKNKLPELKWEEEWSKQLVGKIDLTLANIIDGVLLDLKPEFQKMESSWYIFTGVLNEREDAFLAEMLQSWDLQLQTRLAKGEWVGFLFRSNQ